MTCAWCFKQIAQVWQIRTENHPDGTRYFYHAGCAIRKNHKRIYKTGAAK